MNRFSKAKSLISHSYRNKNARNFFNFATKEDINILKADIKYEMNAMRTDINILKADIKQEINTMRMDNGDFKNEILVNNKLICNRLTSMNHKLNILIGCVGTLYLTHIFKDDINQFIGKI